MAEPPRDPLAEHPLAPRPEPPRRTSAGKTLDLFGAADAPLRPGEGERAEADEPETPERGRSAVRPAEEILAPPCMRSLVRDKNPSRV